MVSEKLLHIPTTNSCVEQKIAGFKTITEALDYAATGETGLTFYNSKGEVDEAVSYQELRERALQSAGKLRALGAHRGDVVAIVADTSVDFLSLFYGCQYAGLVACPLPYTLYMGGRAAFLEKLCSLTETAKARILCIPDSLSELASELRGLTNCVIASFGQFVSILPAQLDVPLGPDEAAYIQFSSGSTSEPKGIIISQKAISSNAKGILQECIDIHFRDRAFSWLPFYHDMGLVGFSIAPMFAQISVDYIAPSTFARRPLLWLQLMSRNRSTITYAPVFGYRLAALRYNQQAVELDLSALRLAGIGGDMIRAEQLNDFANIMSATGFDAASFVPSYGMAEASLLVTYSHGLKTDTIDKFLFEEKNIAQPSSDTSLNSLTLTVCGTPLEGHSVVICGDDGKPLPDRCAGHIFIAGASLMSGYCNAQVDTMTVNGVSGYLNTGDIGYICDEGLVITGRYKEMITINGRNIWPQDIENAVSKISELNKANVAAFSIEGLDSEVVIVLVEGKLLFDGDAKHLKIKIISVISAAVGISPVVYFVPIRSFEYTSSGKLTRFKIKEIFLSNDYKYLI